MNQTPLLKLPYLFAEQAQKHVTHNEALKALDPLVQASVLSASLATPPANPVEGDAYIVAAGATGAWATNEGKIAQWVAGIWQFATPQEGWRVYDRVSAILLLYAAGAWVPFADQGGPGLSQFGINTGADTYNRLALSSDASLFTHAGAGHQLKLNKASSPDTASVLFQSNWSGRAEFGLAGDDNWRVKVSADGATWNDALVVDAASGRVRLPAGFEHASSGRPLVQLMPCPVAEAWRCDAGRPATPRNYSISAVSGANITLATADALTISGAQAQGNILVRIWNTTKVPAEAAWVSATDGASTLTVHNAADVSGWLANENLRLGDPNPTGSNVLDMIAIDISPYMQTTFGQVFAQKGLLMSVYVSGTGGSTSLDASGSGAVGSAAGTGSNADGSPANSQISVFTDQLSPVSNSNLLFVRESLVSGTALTISFFRLVGIYV